MKIRESNEKKIEFKPFEVTLTIENKRELEALWLIFNASTVAMTDFLNNIGRSKTEILPFTTYEINTMNKDMIWEFFNEKIK